MTPTLRTNQRFVLWRRRSPCSYTRIVSGSNRKLCYSQRCILPSCSHSVALDPSPLDTSVWRAVVRVLRSPLDCLSCALFPSGCALCGRSILRLTQVPVCDVCWSRLAPQSGSMCIRCGEDLGVQRFSVPLYSKDDPRCQTNTECRPCRLAPPAFSKAIAYGVYQTELRSLIHLLKYRGMRPIADNLGRHMASCLSALDTAEPGLVPKRMLVVPVPMYRAKRRQRGFDHAELLGCAMIRELRRRKPGWNLKLNSQLLERRRATASQAGLTPRQRRENLRGAFSLRAAEKVAGRDLLLVDDIYTSGATARACSRVLRDGGARSVWVVTAARAQREGVAFWSSSGDTAGNGRPASR